MPVGLSICPEHEPSTIFSIVCMHLFAILVDASPIFQGIFLPKLYAFRIPSSVRLIDKVSSTPFNDYLLECINKSLTLDSSVIFLISFNFIDVITIY